MAKAKEPAKPKTSAKKPDEPPNVTRYCSFCRKPSTEVLALIAGPNCIFICDNCLEVCVAILLDDENPNKDTPIIWRQRITDLLANPKKFNIETIDEAEKGQGKINA